MIFLYYSFAKKIFPESSSTGRGGGGEAEYFIVGITILFFLIFKSICIRISKFCSTSCSIFFSIGLLFSLDFFWAQILFLVFDQPPPPKIFNGPSLNTHC